MKFPRGDNKNLIVFFIPLLQEQKMSWMTCLDFLLCKFIFYCFFFFLVSQVSKFDCHFTNDVFSHCVTRCQDESLAQSGLYDTAEILDELVREGYLSSADLDFTSSLRAAQNSR